MCSDEGVLPRRFESPATTPITPVGRSGSDTLGTPKPRKSTRNLNKQFDKTTKVCPICAKKPKPLVVLLVA